VRLPAAATEITVHSPARWVGGWDVEIGDPLITAIAFATTDGQALGAWVAGDAPLTLPAGAAMRLPAQIQISVHRRQRADYEKPVTPKPSALRFLTRASAPRRIVRVETLSCGAARSGPAAQLLAVRPLPADGASSRMWLERPGAPRAIVGWFRDVDAAYPRTYWLARPLDLPPESRLESDTPCRVVAAVVSAR
jgi:hypothetical protein